MNCSTTNSKITVRCLVGAVLGLLAGLLLVWVDAIDNPFWVMAVGIAAGAGSYRARGQRDGDG